MAELSACDACLARSWLLGRLAGHLHGRERIDELLQLSGDDLIEAVGGTRRAAVTREQAAFTAEAYRARCAAAGLRLVCGCAGGYPASVRALASPPAVLHVAGVEERWAELWREPSVAIVGARRATPYALDMARLLGRGVARAGVTVVSGMARGVDAAAHEGALQSGARTVAVLAAAPQRPYPPTLRSLHRRILRGGIVVSELGPDVAVRRWMFPARNRIIAALSAMTVVVAAASRSGAMLTAGDAAELGRVVGAVPGPATAALSWGPHRLLREGARLVADAADVLEVVRPGEDVARARRPSVEARLQPLLDALCDGSAAGRALEEAGLDPRQGMAALAELELAGHIKRRAGGGFSILR